MLKLLRAYEADPSPANAAKVAAYYYRHPMSAAILDPDWYRVFDAARSADLATRAKAR